MEDFQFDFVAAPEPDRERGLRALGLADSSLLEIMLHKLLLDAWARDNLAMDDLGEPAEEPVGEPVDGPAGEAGRILARAAVLARSAGSAGGVGEPCAGGAGRGAGTD